MAVPGSPIHVLISTRVTAEQLEGMRRVHARLVIHGEPGGIAITEPSAAEHKGMDYPEDRPDLDVPAMLRQAEVIVAARMPPDLEERAPNLRWIQFASAGIDRVWQPFLDKGRITVTSARAVYAVPLAEFALSCMLIFAKGWLRMIRQQREHRYENFVIEELHGSTLVVVGAGAIGGTIARAGKQLGMHVIGVRRREGAAGVPRDFDEMVQAGDLAAALPRGDYVVACLPLTSKTSRVLNEGMFRAMKRSAVFVNVGRGKTVDEAALVRALREGWIRGAALDVYEQEPLPPTSPLWDMPNVLVSPHMGADTDRSRSRLIDLVCVNLRRYAEGKPLHNVVDRTERY